MTIEELREQIAMRLAQAREDAERLQAALDALAPNDGEALATVRSVGFREQARLVLAWAA